MRENNWIYLLQRIIVQQVKNIFKPSQFDSRRLKQEIKAFFYHKIQTIPKLYRRLKQYYQIKSMPDFFLPVFLIILPKGEESNLVALEVISGIDLLLSLNIFFTRKDKLQN
jgi:hypothetical protein